MNFTWIFGALLSLYGFDVVVGFSVRLIWFIIYIRISRASLFSAEFETSGSEKHKKEKDIIV